MRMRTLLLLAAFGTVVILLVVGCQPVLPVSDDLTAPENAASIDIGNGAKERAGPVSCKGPGNTNCCSSNALCFYMKPDGDDENNKGTSEEDAVASLDQVQKLILDYDDREDGPLTTDIEVRIKQGTYPQPEAVEWSHYNKAGYAVTFMPSDYTWGLEDSFEGRPIFTGQGSDSYWFSFFVHAGEPTRLGFYYLEVKEYSVGGIALAVGRRDPALWNGYNTVSGMYFHHLGTQWTPGTIGYGGVVLENSRNNLIEDNDFINIENNLPGDSDGEASHIHALYLRNWARNNVIRGNTMSYITGDPVRVRNGSNNNDIRDNTLDHTGIEGQYSDWYQDASGVCSGVKHDNQECPSWRNWFRNNVVICGYDGTKLSLFHFSGKEKESQDWRRACVPDACTDYKEFGYERVETASNSEATCPVLDACPGPKVENGRNCCMPNGSECTPKP